MNYHEKIRDRKNDSMTIIFYFLLHLNIVFMTDQKINTLFTNHKPM